MPHDILDLAITGGPAIEESATPTSRIAHARRYVYEHLHASDKGLKSEHVIRVTLASLIGLSILSVILETVPEIEKHWSTELYIFEIITVLVFSIEYLLRVWSAVEDYGYAHPILGRLRYMCSPLGLVDLVAILPFYLPGVVSIDLRFLRGLRLIRLMRVMKLGHYSHSLTLISKVIRKKRHDMAATLLIVIILLIFASSVMFYIEHDAQPAVFSSIPASLWWGIATLTTVGYGDIVPVTLLGRVFASVISILGIGVFALPSGIFVAGFVEEMQHKREVVFCDNCKAQLPPKTVEAHEHKTT